MSSSHLTPDPVVGTLPTHKDLPDRDDSVMPHVQQPPQTEMLNQCLVPVLNEIHPDGRYCVAGDCFSYYRLTQPVLDGCKAPDWFYVPGVEPMLDGEIRRSFVLWQEAARPLVVMEYVSVDGREEHDATVNRGKFWAYERAIAATYYVIFDPLRSTLEVYELVAGRYQAMTANPAGRFLIPPMRVELGVWEGVFRGLDGAWLRGWDPATGKMLPLLQERAEAAEAGLEEVQSLLNEQVTQTDTERRRADEATRRAAALAARLRELGIDPDEVKPS